MVNEINRKEILEIIDQGSSSLVMPIFNINQDNWCNLPDELKNNNFTISYKNYNNLRLKLTETGVDQFRMVIDYFAEAVNSISLTPHINNSTWLEENQESKKLLDFTKFYDFLKKIVNAPDYLVTLTKQLSEIGYNCAAILEKCGPLNKIIDADYIVDNENIFRHEDSLSVNQQNATLSCYFNPNTKIYGYEKFDENKEFIEGRTIRFKGEISNKLNEETDNTSSMKIAGESDFGYIEVDVQD